MKNVFNTLFHCKNINSDRVLFVLESDKLYQTKSVRNKAIKILIFIALTLIQ